MRVGDALLRLRFWSRAARHFRKALADEPSAWAHTQLASALWELGEDEQAMAQYRKAYAMHPRPDFAVQLARAEYDLGNLQRAREMMAEARLAAADLDEPNLGVLEDLEARAAGDCSNASE